MEREGETKPGLSYPRTGGDTSLVCGAFRPGCGRACEGMEAPGTGSREAVVRSSPKDRPGSISETERPFLGPWAIQLMPGVGCVEKVDAAEARAVTGLGVGETTERMGQGAPEHEHQLLTCFHSFPNTHEHTASSTSRDRG